MRKACFFIRPDSELLQNRIFYLETIGGRIKSDGYPFLELRKELAKLDIDLSTQDINPPEDSKFVFCLDQPQYFAGNVKKEGQVWCLLISEPPMYSPFGWKKEYHKPFDFVYSYDRRMADEKKYFHYYFAIDTCYFAVPDLISESEFQSRNLCTMISSAIQPMPDKTNKGSLLFERYRAIKWFANNHPVDFRFYGASFEKNDYYFGFRGVGFLKRLLPASMFRNVAKYFQKKICTVYGGQLPALDKFKKMSKYKFYLCYENYSDINGMVSEKLFDCFYNSVVPVYWGAPNVNELIPDNCFIDGTRFTNFNELYDFLKAMTFSEYQTYLLNTRKFLQSEDLYKFTVSNYARTILRPLNLMQSEYSDF